MTEAPTPIKPYLINAVLDYCRDTGCTPYLVVAVDDACRVPLEYVRDGHIVFNISDEATNRLAVTVTELSFQGRFGENNEIFDVSVPLNRIEAITPLEHQEFALSFSVTPTEAPKEAEQVPAQSRPRRPTRLK